MSSLSGIEPGMLEDAGGSILILILILIDPHPPIHLEGASPNVPQSNIPKIPNIPNIVIFLRNLSHTLKSGPYLSLYCIF